MGGAPARYFFKCHKSSLRGSRIEDPVIARKTILDLRPSIFDPLP
jgi:hypothetical protein